jgi:hypothetical protein
MCFDTAKQCVLIHIHKTIIELKFDNQDGYAGSRIDYFKRLQSDVKIVSVTLAELSKLTYNCGLVSVILPSDISNLR